jgi:hypothetical protein
LTLAAGFLVVAIGCAAWALVELHLPLPTAVVGAEPLGGVGGGPTSPIDEPPAPSPSELPSLAEPSAVPKAPAMSLGLAWKALESGELDRGRELARTCVEADPARPGCRAALVVAIARQGAVDEARKLLETLTDPGADTAIAQGELALAEKDPDRACENLHNACDPAHPYACRREKEVCSGR